MLKKLRVSSGDDVKINVFINADLTPLERHHQSALREELKLCIAARTKGSAIRSDKIVRVTIP